MSYEKNNILGSLTKKDGALQSFPATTQDSWQYEAQSNISSKVNDKTAESLTNSFPD